jgi:hypothetical protein
MSSSISILDANTIEIHYWLKDGTHSMDANVFNKCEYELLGIIKEVSSALKVQIQVETMPIGEGGLKAWLKCHEVTGNQVILSIVLFLCTEIVFTPVTTTLDYITTKVLEYIFEDPEIKALENEKKKEELKLDIAKLKRQTLLLCDTISENKVKKRKSNFYEAANKCKKIEKITFSVTDTYKTNNLNSKDVLAKDFPLFIMTSDVIEPDNDEQAIIEIVSPVLKKGKYMWVGIYNGIVIQFKMKSNEFKTLVQTGQIPFKNGSSIQCHLMTNKKINNEGEIIITGYEVIAVDKYFMNDTPIETPEGKRRRQKLEIEKRHKQLHLFDDIN